MADALTTLDKAGGAVRRLQGVLLPLAAAGLILVVFIPLAPWMMDVLLAANIALSAVILLTAIQVASPMEFNLFPSVLLGATLLRLVLNVATTRLILTAGEGGRDLEQAQTAAGQVIWAVSDFVASGSPAVGIILFAIIAIIQFVVVTKGAGRISEVAARFVLDAMPGKQMAIDADMNAKLIDAEQARTRRQAVAAEADFYGAMDGASKFIRGEAVASVLIIIVNLLGGMYVGVRQYGWNWGDTVNLFSRLAIGDGLVMQVPALIVSVAAALLVTRSTAKTDFSREIARQLTGRPIVLAITAGFLGLLCLTHLPKLPLLVIGVACGGLAWTLSRRQSREQDALEQKAQEAAVETPAAPIVQKVDDLLAVDPMRIELGYALVRIAETMPGANLLDRIAMLRKQMAEELGLLVPPVRVRDDMTLESHSYVIRIRGGKVASGRLHVGQLLAVGGDATIATLRGRQALDPVSGKPGMWISAEQIEHAEAMGCTIFDAVGVLANHLTDVIRRHASDLLSREQVAKLLDNLRPTAASLVREVDEKLRMGQLQRVLQSLLRERVSIRDLETILESSLEAAEKTDNAQQIAEYVRSSLARELCQQLAGSDGKLHAVCLDASLEDALTSYAGKGAGGAASMPMEFSQRAARAVGEALGTLVQQGYKPVVLCAPQIRLALRQLVAPLVPDAAVLGYNELESVEVQTVCNAGMES